MALLCDAPVSLRFADSEICRRHRDGGRRRNCNAVLLLLEREKILAEGAGAAALAALVNRRIPLIRITHQRRLLS